MTAVHARPVSRWQRLQAVQLSAAAAAGHGLRWLGGAGEALAGLVLASVGAAVVFGAGWGLMVAGAVLLADVVWQRVS